MIESLHIAGYKLFRDITLPKLGRMNLFVGENNTGKSCLLEAISLYGSRTPGATLFQTAALRTKDPLKSWEISGWNEEDTVLRHPVFDLFSWKGSLESPLGSKILVETRDDPKPLHFEVELRFVVSDQRGFLQYLDASKHYGIEGHRELVVVPYRGSLQAGIIPRQFRPLFERGLNPEKLAYEGAAVIAHLPASGFSDEKAASLWDQLIQGPGQERVLNWMRLVDPRIQDLDFIAGRDTSRIALLKVEGEGRIPLSSMGDGLRRMFHIGLAMATASKGVLLIDEFETGLHWRVQQELWFALGKAAQEFDVQIFATTHSRDCIQGFVTASNEAAISDAKIYRMERDGDEIYAVDLALINVEDALEINGEVR